MAEDGRAGFGPLIDQARTGGVTLKVDPQAFLALDRAMQQRKTEIEAMQQLVRKVSEHESWGLGEQSGVLTSAHTLVQRFRGKGMGGPNSAFDTLQDHWRVADELQTLFRTIRRRLEQTDADFAARLRAVQASTIESV
ncbi:hypothetical protein [Nocardia transvalensis]|uniref:hypothetical protein n=1 Tax=Nocardia transvalensis TaxID=37333 RepID=UPI0018951FC5|nr:hypothetical protein [Nocardia transvalensis]MBF6331416.1 hypothetical protein [Nocardia transvalensis]